LFSKLVLAQAFERETPVAVGEGKLRPQPFGMRGSVGESSRARSRSCKASS
jgi:hypothetical protein